MRMLTRLRERWRLSNVARELASDVVAMREPISSDMLTPSELEQLRESGNEARAFGIREFGVEE